MTEQDELTEKVAIALWQSDSIRVAGKLRNVPWKEQSEDTKLTFRTSANAAIEACEVDQLKEQIQDMFTDMHHLLDGVILVGDKRRSDWMTGKITMTDAVIEYFEETGDL